MPTGNPLIDGYGGGKKKNPLIYPGGAAGGTKKKNPLLGPTSSSTAAERAASVPALEQEVEAAGAPAPAQDSPSAFRRIIDVISRPNYAAAGAAEELFAPQGGGVEAAIKRAGTELFSGIGGLKGQKEGFGEVLEQSGVGELGQFSDIAGFLYNDTGEGLALQRGGWADPTGRGAIGLGLDIVADPTTYLGFGVAGKTAKVEGKFLSKAGMARLADETAIAGEKYVKELGEDAVAAQVREISLIRGKQRVAEAINAGATDLVDKGGIKFAGIHVAENPLTAIANSGVSKELIEKFSTTKAGQAVLASTAWTKKNLTDPLATLFIRGYGIRGLHGAKDVIDDHLNLEGFLKGAAQEEIKASPLGKWYDKSAKEIETAWRPVIDAYQAGGIASVPSEFKEGMAFYAKKAEEMFQAEVRAGLIQTEQKLANYFAHYYDNDVEELALVIYKNKGGIANPKDEVNRLLRMGRNAEERAYDTLKEAETISKQLNAQNKSIPILKGVYNPIDSLTRRWEHSITKRVNRQMVDSLSTRFGPMDLSKVYDLARPVKYGAQAAHEKAAVDALLAAPSKDVREASTKATKVFETHELRLANQNVEKAWDSLPIKHYEKQTLKNLDEAAYFRRRGWDIVENPAGAARDTPLYTAYRLREVSPQQYSQFTGRLNAAKQQVAMAAKRATREIEIPGKLTKGVDKSAELRKMSETQKQDFFVRRFQQVTSRKEANGVLRKYMDEFKDWFPSGGVNDRDFAADGSRFIAFSPGGKFEAILPETLAREVGSMSDLVVTNKAFRKVLENYDKVTNFWKGSVTYLFPAFHVRNAYSNVAQSFVDISAHSLNPASYIETGKILFTDAPGIVKTPLGTYTYKEVREMFERHGIKTSAAAKAEFTGNAGFYDKVGGALGWARKGGTAIENESRAQLALNYLKRGMDPEEIGKRVKKFQLDYQHGLTQVEREFMRRLIPFYAFQRLNMGLILENLTKRPGMTLAELKPFMGRNSENEQMTSWDAGALKLRLNKDGKHVQMITGIDLPIRNLDLLFRGTVQGTMANAVGMLAPIPKSFIEVAAGKSLFTGKDFGRTNSPVAGFFVEKMPGPIQRWMGYDKTYDPAGHVKHTFDGERFYLLAQSYATSRFLSTADRQWNKYLGTAEPNHLAAMLDFVTGLRFQDMDMDEEMSKRASERKRDLEQALVRWGKRAEFERVYKPKPKGGPR